MKRTGGGRKGDNESFAQPDIGAWTAADKVAKRRPAEEGWLGLGKKAGVKKKREKAFLIMFAAGV